MMLPADAATCKNIKHRQRRVSSLMARGLLRYLLSTLANIKPTEIFISSDSSGRPWLYSKCHTQAIFASITHSQNIVAAIVDVNRPVGIDVEIFRPNRDFQAISQRIFTKRIAAALGSPADFYRCWCLYEAWVKVSGGGPNSWRADNELMALVNNFLTTDNSLLEVAGVIFLPIVKGYTGCVIRGPIQHDTARPIAG